MNIIKLSPWDLAIGGALVLVLASLALVSRIGVAGSLVVAAIRLVVQLMLIGFVLKALFNTTNPLWICLMAFVMLVVAGREASARQKRRLAGWWGYGIGTGAMFLSSFAVCIFALACIIQADPWYEPRYAIPVLGMLLGNTMTAIALSLDRITDSASQQRDVIEQRLMLGEDRATAIGDIAREAQRIALIPVINSMAVAGVVSLPGMMTGQILAGNSPIDAVKYQILIWLLIAAGTGFGIMLAVRLTTRRLFDERHRLRLDRLKQKGRKNATP